MKKIKQTFLCIALATSSFANTKNTMNMGMDTNFSFDDVFNKAHAQIERIEAELKHALSTMPQTNMPATIIGTKSEMPTVTDDNQSVYISLKLANVNFDNMVMKKVDGQNGTQLNVTIPLENRTVELTIKEETIMIATKYEMKEEKEDQNERSLFSSFSVSQTIQSLPSKVLLNDPQAEYDETKGTLIISLKKVDLPKSQVISIKKK